MRAEHQMLAARWFERLVELLPVDAGRFFRRKVSWILHSRADCRISASICANPRRTPSPPIRPSSKRHANLAALRHAQQASLHQLLREYHVLSGVLVTFVLEEMDRLGVAPAPSAGVILVARLHQAVDVLAQSTVELFVALYAQTITDQRERLEQFTRMAAHEWRQPLGALQFGVKLLKVESLDQARTHRTLEIVERNVDQLVALTQKLETVARINDAGDNLLDQEVSVATVANEAARQLREMADARSVEIRVSDTLPTVTVDVGRLELTLVNLLSNGIKYSDATKPERYVEITGVESGDELCRIMVSDNGLGIPAASLNTIFHRFTRAHEDRDDLKHVGGMGLGLSIVEDSVQAMQGHIEVVSTEGVGTTFVLTLPMTRRNAR